MHDLTALSATQLTHLIKQKKTSCLEIVSAYLKQIEKVNPLINALDQQLPPEIAIQEAKKADAAIAKNSPLGKLHGIPVVIKDARKVKGFLCSYGNESPMNQVATEDCTVAARLRAEGAIIMGISNIPDFSMSYETDNIMHGATRNPYDFDRSPGGSSGGVASILAAGGAAIGIGSDSGGSIREPAHNCGIAGLKPSMGLIPNTGLWPDGGLFGIMSLVCTQGPMARFVEDLILSLPILSGPDGHDPNIYPIPLLNPADVDLKNLRVAFYADNEIASPNEDIIKTIENAAHALLKDVKKVTRDHPKVTKQLLGEFEELFFYGGDKGRWLHDIMDQMKVKNVGAPFQAILDRALLTEFSTTELRNRLIKVDQFKYQMMDFIKNYDVILCPVATAHAHSYKNPSAEKFDLAGDLTYNLPYNITGWPAAVVRCGTASNGMPIGVQVIAKAWRDDVALAVAHHLEKLFGGWEKSRILQKSV